jgi:hypothetical protein
MISSKDHSIISIMVEIFVQPLVGVLCFIVQAGPAEACASAT